MGFLAMALASCAPPFGLAVIGKRPSTPPDGLRLDAMPLLAQGPVHAHSVRPHVLCQPPKCGMRHANVHICMSLLFLLTCMRCPLNSQLTADLGWPQAPPPLRSSLPALACDLMAVHFRPSRALAAGLDPREAGPADELLTQASAALMRAHSVSLHGDLSLMLLALLVLEAGVVGRPYCAAARLSLTALHGLLGAPRSAARHFGALDAKHIQLDTLAGHHLLPVSCALGAGVVAAPLLRATCALFEEHARDGGESLGQAYMHNTHTKVQR